MEQISSTVVDIASVTQQSSKGAEQMAASSENLNDQTKSLTELVGQFKITDQTSVDK